MSSTNNNWADDPRLTAYALGEATEVERAAIDAALANGDAGCRAALDELQRFMPDLESMFEGGDAVLGDASKAEILAASREASLAKRRRMVAGVGTGLLAAAAAAVLVSIPADESRLGGESAKHEIDVLGGNSMEVVASNRAPEGAPWKPVIDVDHAGKMILGKTNQPGVDALKSLGYMGYAGGNVDVGLRFQVPGQSDGYYRGFTIGGVNEDGTFISADPDVVHNGIVVVAEDPKSTFAIDVDTASYTRTRQTLRAGRMPSAGSVRIEEFINYFDYRYPSPNAGAEHPFLVTSEVSSAPWAPDNRLVRIGVQGERIDASERPAANLVFLIDVSGSMGSPQKLPLVTQALAVLTESLRPDDRIAMVVYAASEGVVLDSTPAAARETILQALESLQAGGSTNGGAGIQRAYSIARDHLVAGGINRVILCTDGDFNVGISSDEALEDLIAKEAADGVDLTVLGFGGGQAGFRDEKMEKLSNRGNGNFAYIDSELEARRVLAGQVGSTLQTIARDVKIQVEWDPRVVESFRLIGYENRVLAHEDFENDAVDAGEIGAGHSVTALYEVTLHPGVAGENDLGEVRFRYRRETGDTTYAFDSTLVDTGASFGAASDAHRFCASVASFGMQLRGSPFAGETDFDKVRTWSLEAIGGDETGMREEFVRLVEEARKNAGD